MILSEKDRSWFVYSMKIGILAGILIGGGFFMFIGETMGGVPQLFTWDFFYWALGVLMVGCGVILLIGAYATWNGITLESMRNMRVQVIPDKYPPRRI